MIDWPFLGRLEGSRLAGYVPVDHAGLPLGRSGVTIATGVDLGQVSPQQIDRWALSPGLRARLRPYAGIRGPLALRTLHGAPLAVSEPEARAITAAVAEPHLQGLRHRFNDVAQHAMPPLVFWDRIPDAAQTVIFSVDWQYGDLERECPRFWRAAAGAQDWTAVIAELRAFGDAYPTRRNSEADYLEAAIAGAAIA